MTDGGAVTRGLHDLDWVITLDGGRLHHAVLTDRQAEDLEYDGTLGVEVPHDGPFRLDCGRLVDGLSIPGVFSRMSLPRCRRCCTVNGLPQGIGSPKNDGECRKILGLEDRDGSSS